MDQICDRCGSTDRKLDADFHCSTCWANLKASADALADAVEKELQGECINGPKCSQEMCDFYMECSLHELAKAYTAYRCNEMEGKNG